MELFILVVCNRDEHETIERQDIDLDRPYEM